MWTEKTVAGHLCDVYEPQGPADQAFAIVYLHGLHLNRLVDQCAFTREFDRHGLRVVCPRTARSWWTDKICAEFDPAVTAERYVLDSIVPYVAERWNVRPPGIGLLGTSMGGQGALRFAFKRPRVFPVVAAISPVIDYQVRMREGDETLRLMYRDAEQARQDTATLHVHPLNWPRHIWFACDPSDRWHESAEKLRMKLAALGIPYQCDLETLAGGHGFEYYSHMAPAAVGFLVEKLKSEKLRVV